NAPAGKEFAAHEAFGDACGTRARGDAGEQHVSRVRGSDAARPFRTVERKHIHAELIVPERTLEALAYLVSLPPQLRGELLLADGARHPRGEFTRQVDVSLNLAECDGSLR